jgi:histidinol-phosphatase (PHP family)
MTDLKEFFLDYLDDQYTMLRRIRPTVVGHFDLCRLFSPGSRLDEDPGVWAKLRRNVDFIVQYGGLFEVNAASFRKGWDQAYPGSEVIQVRQTRRRVIPRLSLTHTDPRTHLLQLIKSSGGKLCLSDDSHGPAAVGLNYGRLRSYLIQERVNQIWYLTDERESTGKVDEDRSGDEGMGGKVWAKKYEGDWAADVFWEGLDG